VGLLRHAAPSLADARPSPCAHSRHGGLDSDFSDSDSAAGMDGVTFPHAGRNAWQSPATHRNIHSRRVTDHDDSRIAGSHHDQTRVYHRWAGLDGDAHSHTRRA